MQWGLALMFTSFWRTTTNIVKINQKAVILRRPSKMNNPRKFALLRYDLQVWWCECMPIPVINTSGQRPSAFKVKYFSFIRLVIYWSSPPNKSALLTGYYFKSIFDILCFSCIYSNKQEAKLSILVHLNNPRFLYTPTPTSLVREG